MILLLSVCAAVLLAAAPAFAQSTVKVGWCARTISAAGAPFAVAEKLGWFREGGIKVELVPLPGSTDCVKLVATGDLPYALPSIEPLAMLRPQGVKMRNFYTAYQGNIYGLAVPEGSDVRTYADLRGKKIGVTSMASGGYVVARALAASAGLNPDTDVRIVAVGEGAQAAALVRAGQVDVLSLFDAQYALVENAGTKLRMLDNSLIAGFPSNGFVAMESRLADHRAEAVALARGYAMGTVFALANPEAAVRMLFEVFPQTKPTGKDDATALREAVRPLIARLPVLRLEAGGVTKWGENSAANYDAYIDFLTRQGVLKAKVAATDIVTNDLIDDINRFDPATIGAQARATGP